MTASVPVAVPTIVGAGLSGLIAAHAWPRARIVERETEPRAHHKAVLRFRGEAISALTGVEFRKVVVRKAIWAEGAFRAPSLRYANAYSAKVLGRIENDRSVWSLDPVERWIAPDDLYERLVQAVGSRIEWGTSVQWNSAPDAVRRPLISTVPLPSVMKALGEERADIAFNFSPITVRRYSVRDCDVFQTVYFPDRDTPLYRASITGDLLIAEFIGEAAEHSRDLCELERAFGIEGRLKPIETVSQKYGKIAPIDPVARRALLLHLTTRYEIYSLGRFATWRNVLLDDLVHDIAVIRRLLAGDHYASRLAAAT